MNWRFGSLPSDGLLPAPICGPPTRRVVGPQMQCPGPFCRPVRDLLQLLCHEPQDTQLFGISDDIGMLTISRTCGHPVGESAAAVNVVYGAP